MRASPGRSPSSFRSFLRDAGIRSLPFCTRLGLVGAGFLAMEGSWGWRRGCEPCQGSPSPSAPPAQPVLLTSRPSSRDCGRGSVPVLRFSMCPLSSPGLCAESCTFLARSSFCSSRCPASERPPGASRLLAWLSPGSPLASGFAVSSPSSSHCATAAASSFGSCFTNTWGASLAAGAPSGTAPLMWVSPGSAGSTPGASGSQGPCAGSGRALPGVGVSPGSAGAAGLGAKAGIPGDVFFGSWGLCSGLARRWGAQPRGEGAGGVGRRMRPGWGPRAARAA